MFQGVLLQALVDRGSPPGSLDGCLEELLPLMEADLFSAAADAKAEAAFASKHKEAKTQRAYATFELLARLTTFSSHVEVLLLPVRERLAEASAPRTRNILTTLLQHAGRGVAANSGATSADILMYSYQQLKRTLAAEAARRTVEAVAQNAGASGDGSASGTPVATEDPGPNEELVTEFALAVLLARARRGRLEVSDPDVRARAAPLLPLLADVLAARSTACVLLALRCLTALAPAQLPGIPEAARAAGRHIGRVLDRTPKLESPVAQVCHCARGASPPVSTPTAAHIRRYYYSRMLLAAPSLRFPHACKLCRRASSCSPPCSGSARTTRPRCRCCATSCAPRLPISRPRPPRSSACCAPCSPASSLKSWRCTTSCSACRCVPAAPLHACIPPAPPTARRIPAAPKRLPLFRSRSPQTQGALSARGSCEGVSQGATPMVPLERTCQPAWSVLMHCRVGVWSLGHTSFPSVPRCTVSHLYSCISSSSMCRPIWSLTAASSVGQQVPSRPPRGDGSLRLQSTACMQEEAVRSPEAALRGTCAAALLQFLLDWPLQERRLQQHLQFLVSNLSFELEDGRLQVRPPAHGASPRASACPAPSLLHFPHARGALWSVCSLLSAAFSRGTWWGPTT